VHRHHTVDRSRKSECHRRTRAGPGGGVLSAAEVRPRTTGMQSDRQVQTLMELCMRLKWERGGRTCDEGSECGQG